jgi:hypothetical protein
MNATADAGAKSRFKARHGLYVVIMSAHIVMAGVVFDRLA